MKIRRLENGKLGRHGETALGAGLATALLIKCGAVMGPSDGYGSPNGNKRVSENIVFVNRKSYS